MEINATTFSVYLRRIRDLMHDARTGYHQSIERGDAIYSEIIISLNEIIEALDAE